MSLDMNHCQEGWKSVDFRPGTVYDEKSLSLLFCDPVAGLDFFERSLCQLEIERFVREIWISYESVEQNFVVATLEKSDAIVGTAHIRQGTIAYFVASAFWVRGIASGMIAYLLDSPESCKADQSIDAFIRRDNRASIFLAEAVGFRFCGLVQRRNMSRVPQFYLKYTWKKPGRTPIKLGKNTASINS